MCGNRCGEEVFGSLHSDWTGEPEASRGGSAIRHKCEGVGTATDMAAGKRMHGSGHGEYRFVLETGVQHFGRKPQDHFRQSGTGEGAARRRIRMTAGGWRACCGMDWCKGASFRHAIFVNCGI